VPFVLYSASRFNSVPSPPAAGNTTSRTTPSGAPTAASVILNKMFSLPDTRFRSATNSPTTRRSARALILCTVAISRSTRVSVISRPRQYSSAASSVSLISSGWSSRRWLGNSAAARSRQLATTFGAMPANTPDGRPIARIAASLATSSRTVARLTLPGSSLICANSARPSSPGSSSASPSSPPPAIRAFIRAATCAGIRPVTFATSAFSASRSPEPMIRLVLPGAGCSMPSCRHRFSSSSRTRSGRRSPWQTSPASHAASFSASATVHSRKPRNLRT